MKPHLPLLLRAALLAACSAAFLCPESSAEEVSVGNIMQTGDSITHGIKSATWRWYLFKDFVDNGVENTAVGACKKPNTASVWANAGSVYGDSVFTNLSSAIASGRLDEYAGSTSPKNAVWTTSAVNNGYISAEYANTYIRNWIADEDGTPLSTTNRTGGTFTGTGFQVDTFVMMLGINDILPSNQSVATCVSNMQTIVNAVQEGNPDTQIYLMSVTPWTEYSSWSSSTSSSNYKAADVTHKTNVVLYNRELESYASTHDNVTYINANKGLIDVTKTTTLLSTGEVVNFTAVANNMLNASDGVHGIAQGDRLLAANVAEGMGIAGRTAGQQRLGADDFTYDVVVTGGKGSQTWAAGDDLTAGFSADIQGLTLGTKYEGDSIKTSYNTTDNLTITLGNGTFSGTLSINDAYITWGDYYLYSTDMAVNTDALRIAYVNGNAAEGLLGGYYVWLGDQLIGEALGANNTSRDNVTNGLSINYGGSSALSVGGVSVTAGSYAPLTTLKWNEDNAYLATAVTKTTSQGVRTFSGATEVTALTNDRVSLVSAATTAGATGTTSLTVNKLMCVVDSATVSGDYALQVALGGGAQVITGAHAATVTGNVCVQVDAEGAVFGMDKSYETSCSYSGALLSYAGAINSSVSGKITGVLNGGTYLTNVVGGRGSGTGNIGSAELFINGGYIQGDVIGGNYMGSGSIGDTAVTITGGSIGGNVYGGSLAGTRTDGATSAVTIAAGTMGGDVYGNDTTGGGTVTIDALADVRGTVHTAALNITGEGTAKLGGLDYTGKTIEVADTATLKVAGTLALSQAVSVSGALLLDNADINLSASAVNDFVSRSGATFSDSDHNLTRNGYCSEDMAIVTAKELSVNGTLSGSGALSGSTLTVENNSVRTQLSAYCINDAETNFVYAASDKQSGVYGASSVILGSGGTLQLAEGLKEGVSLFSNGGTVQIDSGVTLAADEVSGSVKLAGAGTYAVDGGGTTLTANTSPQLSDLCTATLGDDWTGSIRLSNLSGNGLNFTNLRSSNSSVEFNGVSGWLGPWDGSNGSKISYNIKLTDNGDTAAYTWVGAYSSTASEKTGPYFSGAITGDGTFSASVVSSKYCNFTFEGDTKDWTGTFLLTSGSTKLHLQGSATEFGAAIQQNSGATLNVVIGDGTSSFSTKLTNDIDVASVTIAAKAGATLTSGSIGTTTLADSSSKLTKVGEGELSLGTNSITTGTVQLQEGTLRGLALAGGTLELAGGTLAGAILSSGTVNVSAATTVQDSTIMTALSGSNDSTLSLSGSLAMDTNPLSYSNLNVDFSGLKTINLTGFNSTTTEGTTGYSDGLNGYLLTDTTYVLAKGTGGTLTITDGQHVAMGTSAVLKLSISDDGNQLIGTQCNTEYVVNSGIVTYGNGSNATQASSINLTNGTLIISEAMKDGVTVTSSKSANVIQIEKGGAMASSAVSDANYTLKLNGGTYTLDSSNALGKLVQASGSGTVQISGTQNFATSKEVTTSLGGTLELNGTLQFNATAGSTTTMDLTSFDKVKINEGGSLVLNATNTSKIVKANMLEVNGSATVGTGTVYHGDFRLGTLTGTGTLNLSSQSTAQNENVFRLGGSDTAKESFSGTVNLTMNANNNAARGNALVLANTEVAKDAVISFYKQSANTKDGSNLTLALAASGTTKVAGLSDNAGNNASSTAKALIISDATVASSDGVSAYTTSKTDDTVRTLEITGDGAYSTSAAIGKNLNVRMAGEGTQNFTGDMSAFNGSLEAERGALNFFNAAALKAGEVVLAGGATIGAYSGATATATSDTEATLTVDTLRIGGAGATLNANLVLSGSTLELAATLNMGSSVTLANVTLSGDLTDGMTAGDTVTLFRGVDTLTIGSGSALTGDYEFTAADMSAAFANLNEDYTAAYKASTGELTLTMTPEPATATLSLLALAGLCARRRRH